MENQLDFEDLSSNLQIAQRRVSDAESLLCVACALLEASAGLLIRRGASAVLVAAHPAELNEWGREELSQLRRWYKAFSLPRQVDGYAHEEPVEVGDRRFGGAMVAFSDPGVQLGTVELELLLLQEETSKAPFRSYHLWAAASLLRHFEHIQATRLLAEERIFSSLYSSALTNVVLRSEPWEEFVFRLEHRIAQQQIDPKFLTQQAVLWTAYRVRDKAHDKAAGRRLPSKDTETETAFEWLQTSVTVKEGVESEVAALHFLLSKKLMPEDARLFSGLIDEFQKSSETVPGSESQKEPLKIVAVVLEHAWRLRREETAEDGSGSVPSSLAEDREELRAILDLSCRLVTGWLRVESWRKPEGGAGGGEPCRVGYTIGRDELRLYLAALLLQSPVLRSEYLGIHEGLEPRELPPHVKSTFLLNLSRFMLAVLAWIEGRLGIDSEPAAVSQVEVLDSLLYLVDRYAHVVLGVDERLHLREALGRTLPAEVEHYLGRPFYRDHLLHVIDVFLIGHILLEAEIVWLGARRPLIDHLALVVREETERDNRRFWFKQWAVASLLHDTGYRLPHGKAAESDQSAWREFFALRGKIAEPLDPAREGATKRGRFVAGLAEHLRGRGVGNGWLPEPGDEESLSDHGVLSALRTAQILCHAEQGDSRFAGVPEPGLVAEYSRALHAMALHNRFRMVVRLNTHPVSWLLRLCDELQEWGRPRVNVERMVKQLYIDIQDDRQSTLGANPGLERFETNLAFEAGSGEGGERPLVIRVRGDAPHLCFRLRYHDPVKAGYEASITFLSKAYNLQHLDLTAPQEESPLLVHLELQFPCPPDYRGITEYDLYGLFTDRARGLPTLSTYTSVDKARPGLVRIDDGSTTGWDRIGIILQGSPGGRVSWIPLDPSCYYRELVEHKERILGARRRA